jgi:hypothetical protein
MLEEFLEKPPKSENKAFRKCSTHRAWQSLPFGRHANKTKLDNQNHHLLQQSSMRGERRSRKHTGHFETVPEILQLIFALCSATRASFAVRLKWQMGFEHIETFCKRQLAL